MSDPNRQTDNMQIELDASVLSSDYHPQDTPIPDPSQLREGLISGSEKPAASSTGPVTRFKRNPWITVALLTLCTSGLAVVMLAAVVLVVVWYNGGEGNLSPFAKRFKDRRTVILISLDGFRADYLDLHANLIPNISRLAGHGVRAQKLIPIYPTKTFPNHYSLVTGLYAENHGIVSNTVCCWVGLGCVFFFPVEICNSSLLVICIVLRSNV